MPAPVINYNAAGRQEPLSMSHDANTDKLPGTFREFVRRFGDLGRLHQETGEALRRAGPLDEKTIELVKIGMCVGAGLESALRSHIHRAMAAGATEPEIEHAIVLGMTTCGFPATARAWSWANVQFERERAAKQNAEPE